MNNQRRKQIRKITSVLQQCSSDLQGILDDEDDARDNMPENLQDSDRYHESEEWSDSLEDSVSDIDGVVERLEDLM